MKLKRDIPPEYLTMLEAYFSHDAEKWNEWLASQGHEPFDDSPVCLANIPQEAWMENTNVLPTPAIQKYLDSGDVLTPHTIEMMELAMERDYGVKAPWYITSEVPYYNKETEAPVVQNFYLGKES